MSTASELAKSLLQINAIKLNPQNPFTWASGLRSPIYCDNRISLSYPETRQFIKKELAKLSSEFGPFTKIAGVATAGIAHGALLADELDLPFIYVRAKAKEHGRKNQIEGELKEGERILVVEDLISTGGSSVKAVDALRENGATVTGVIAIFSYGFEIAKQNFDNASCKFNTLSTYPVLLDTALQSNYINQEQCDMLQSWNRNPEAWSKQFESKKLDN